MPPSGPPIGPGLDDHVVHADDRGYDNALPPIVADLEHGADRPIRRAAGARGLSGGSPADTRRQEVVTVSEDVGGDTDRLPDDRLGRVHAGRGARANVIDADPAAHTPSLTARRPGAQPARARGGLPARPAEHLARRRASPPRASRPGPGRAGAG